MPTIMRRMNIVARCAAMYRVQQLQDGELRPIHHDYIRSICKYPGKSQQWLCRRLIISKSNVARHIAFLERNGYIERKPSEEDKREMLVYPTQKALDICPEVDRITDEWNALVSEDLTDEEIEIFHTIIKKMLDKSLTIINREG